MKIFKYNVNYIIVTTMVLDVVFLKIFKYSTIY